MKTTIKILLATSVFLSFFSCKEEVIKTPKAEMTVNKNKFDINETMIINFTGIADQVVIYTGDELHNYDFREGNNSGLVVNKNLFTYAYSVAGIYKVVCVASTYDDILAKNLKIDTCSFIVEVIDDVTDINKISCPRIIYDEVFAENIENDEWLMRLPRRIKFGNNENANINIASQRLKFYINSDSTKVFIDGKNYSGTTNYNLSVPLDVLVKSYQGTERPYKLYTMNIPEFNTFLLDGVNGTVKRNEFDYYSLIWQVNLPAGTNVSELIPEFTTHLTTEKVYIGNTEQISGISKVDFTEKVVYRIVSVHPDKPEMITESSVVVNINFQ